MTPIFDHRRIIGYATTKTQAARTVRQLLQTIPPGWKVTVRQRNTDLIDLPAGWIYSIHP
jgi:hypothetical protein